MSDNKVVVIGPGRPSKMVLEALQKIGVNAINVDPDKPLPESFASFRERIVLPPVETMTGREKRRERRKHKRKRNK